MPLDVGEHLNLVRGADPSRLREALREAAPHLGLHPPHLNDIHPDPAGRETRSAPTGPYAGGLESTRSADRAGRFFHVDGQSLAPWIDSTTRVVSALPAAGIEIGDLPERLAAYRDANAAGPWWPGTHLVIVCERPVEIGPGPVLRWADGATLDGHAPPPG